MTEPPPVTWVCPECGLRPRDAIDCRAAFDRLLAFEFEVPAAFAAHHLTVAAYYLQHPSGHAPAVLAMWRTLLADALDGRATPGELRRRASARFEGPERVREAGAGAPPWWPRQWPETVEAALPPDESRDPAAHVERVVRWARSVRRALDDAEGRRTGTA